MKQEAFYILFFLLVCFWLEFLIPRSKFSFNKVEIKEDLFWFVTNFFILDFIFSLFTFSLGSYLMFNYNGIISLKYFHTLHPVFEFLIYLLIFDFLSYCGHYLLHNISFLWKFHKLHHSIEDLNPLSAFRHSIYEKLYYSLFFSLTTSFFLVSKTTYFYALMLTFAICILQHSKIKFIFLSPLAKVFITPHNHMYHHSKVNFLKNGQNFGFVFIFWDKLFKTFYVEKADDIELGIDDQSFPKTLLKRFIYPI